jgi:hypothetical protein
MEASLGVAEGEIDGHLDGAGHGLVALAGGHEAPVAQHGFPGNVVEAGKPLLLAMLTSVGRPSGPTCTRSSTRPSSPMRFEALG